MKNSLMCLVLTISCLFFSTTGFCQEPETVRLTNGEWPPYLSEKSYKYGLYSHIVEEAFKIMGIKVEYGFFPWKRSFKLAENGDWDGSTVWAYSPEREKKFLFSEPIGHGCHVFFHLKDFKFDWQTEDDLQGIKIGGTIGYRYLGEMEKLKEEGIALELKPVVTDISGLKMLLHNRIQIFPCRKEVGMELMRIHFSPEDAETITYHPKPWACESYHVVFPKSLKKSARLKKIFDKGLARLHESGKFDQLLEDFAQGKYQRK